MMTKEAEKLRDGVFALHTRRFGTIAELMIEALYSFTRSHNQFHDRYDEVGQKRIEIKFSTVMKKSSATITMKNAIAECKKAIVSKRALSSEEIDGARFDCNIQQVKRLEFDVLYYGLFFTDKIAIFKMNSEEVVKCPGYSDNQHKGNKGEGQFHIKNQNVNYHFEHHFIEWITYDELLTLFKKANEIKKNN